MKLPEQLPDLYHLPSSFLLLPLFVPLVNRKLHGRDYFWMMPEKFGALPENELRTVITKKQEVMKFSQDESRMIGLKMVMALVQSDRHIKMRMRRKGIVK